MSKAYDRVQWDFIEIMQLNLDFPASWVRMMMESITTVTYQVKFTEVITEKFKPKRGLHQGDPLSPYLFLICAEWLSKTLSHSIGIVEEVRGSSYMKRCTCYFTSFLC